MCGSDYSSANNHFRKNNIRDITIPTSVAFSNSENGVPSFSNFSTSGWSGFANTLSDTGTDKVAMFMSYIGSCQDLNYGLSATSGVNEKILEVLNQYKLDGESSLTYSYERVIDNLKSGIPVVICAGYYSESYDVLQGCHAFIIDGYTERYQMDYVSYYWDPNYRITQYDLENAEPWRFQEAVSSNSAEYKDGYLEYHNGSRQTVYIRMNWGYSGEHDDTSYLAYSYMADAANINESVFAPDWELGEIHNDRDYQQYNYVTYIIYDCAEME